MVVNIVPGLQMPFYPMRPVLGRGLRSQSTIKALWKEIQSNDVWVAQPKLNGDRACLAVVDRRVFIQNRHKGWYRLKVQNARDYLRLPDGTCFDGEVFARNFYPFELLALEHHSFMALTTVERTVLAKQFSDYLKQPWMFPLPNLDWMLGRRHNLPQYEGVVLKQSGARYVVHGSESQSTLSWMKRLW